MITILVLEDDPKLNYIVCSTLNDHGYRTIGCKDPEEAFDQLAGESVNLILTDIMMPGMDGFEFAEEIRGQDKQIPILFMTARDDMTSKKRGFLIGIDDYMVKPIDLDELLLRISAILRRAKISFEKEIMIGNFRLSESETTAYINDEDVGLTVKEFNILFKLLSYPKRTFTRGQIMDEFWGFDSESNPRTVDVSITKIREKISACKQIEIQTVRGLGYKAVIQQ
ncbi:MAG: response regulator transcription factor [Lachnospiraceae bacterium]